MAPSQSIKAQPRLVTINNDVEVNNTPNGIVLKSTSPPPYSSTNHTMTNAQTNGTLTATKSQIQLPSSFLSLPSLATPSPAYLESLSTLHAFYIATQEELLRISKKMSTRSSSPGSSFLSRHHNNPYETPQKKLLSSRVELSRMDYMEDSNISAILYQATHITDPEEKATLESSQSYRECQHILDCYEQLRTLLAVRVVPGSTLRALATMLLVFIYTAISIPLFLVTLSCSSLNPIWRRLFHARNHFYPVDLIQKFYARGFLFLCDIRVEWIGMEYLSYDESFIGMFTHASNLDPIIVASGPLAWKWIGKKSLFRIPLIGWILSGLDHIPIERENRSRAIESLKKAAEIIHKYKRCVAISPEGTRSKTGRIQDFKKGGFHTAIQVGAPIIPLLVEGAYELWPSGALFAQSGRVRVTCLPPIKIESGATESYNELASQIRRTFFKRLCETAQQEIDSEAGRKLSKASASRRRQSKEFANFALHSLWMPVSYGLLYILYRSMRIVF